IVAASDDAVALPLLTGLSAPISVPPVLQLLWTTRSAGPQRWNRTFPLQVASPLTGTVAESVTDFAPQTRLTPPLPSDGVVTTLEELTVTFSLSGWLPQAVASTPSVFGGSPLYEATNTYWPTALGVKLTGP